CFVGAKHSRDSVLLWVATVRPNALPLQRLAHFSRFVWSSVNQMYTLIVKATFEAAHDIPGHKGKCARLHGHSYRVEAEFAGTKLDYLGMLRDFGDLKSVLNEFLP